MLVVTAGILGIISLLVVIVTICYYFRVFFRLIHVKMVRLILLVLFYSSLYLLVNGGNEFEDYRCKCVCPSFTVLQDPSMNETNRRVYVDVVAPDNCTCERVVFRTIPASSSFQQRFCPR